MFDDSSTAETISAVVSVGIFILMLVACSFLSAIYDMQIDEQKNCITVEGKIYCEK